MSDLSPTIQKLITAMYNPGENQRFQATRIQGMVVSTDTVNDGHGSLVPVINIKNGKLCDVFYLAGSALPLVGEWVKGCVTEDEVVSLGGYDIKCFIMTRNSTQRSEEDAFSWFKQHGGNLPWMKSEP